MSDNDATKQALAQLDALQQTLAREDSFGCLYKAQNGGMACTRKHDRKFDRHGRFVYHYSPGCKVVEGFCPACSAYWHVAVARNQLIRFAEVAHVYRSDAPGSEK